MRNLYKRPWRKKKKKVKLNNAEYMQIKGNEKLLFVLDDNEWTLEDASKWLNIFSEGFPYITTCLFLKSMFNNIQELTEEEYTVLNNILKKCKYSNEV